MLPTSVWMATVRYDLVMHEVVVLALDDVIAFDLATAVETFRSVRRADGSPGYQVSVAGPGPLVRSGPMSIKLDLNLDALTAADTIVIPGRDDPTAGIDPAVLTALTQAAGRGARLASICVGAFDLAATGLLDGRRATTHWRAAALLAERHPAIRVDPAVLYVDEGSVLTSAGAAAGLDLCLHLVDSDYGAAVAMDTARAAVMPLFRDGGQAQFIDHATGLSSTSLAPVLEWMEAHLAQPVSLDVIAERAHLSARTLSRRFRDQLGTTPSAWLTRARLRRARSLLESTDDSIDRIAAATGLGSGANLRARFQAELGTTPTGYRRAFRTAGGISS